ncbi:MAG: LCP family protein [Chloroflexi bacterium]|nr:LCP family protein [Chloroflexota bacterium]MCI0580658.1 LCP family protein [Chloroflexota bacterium]MCI0648674.1 LCP family protein [Chloroflexota bacterium]MCI0728082.1 LCP family protein [Chloroflexota bacterium]
MDSPRRQRSGVRLPLWGLGVLALAAVLFLAATSAWLFDTVEGLASAWEVTDPDFGVVSEPAGQAGNDPSNPFANPGDSQPLLPDESLEPWSGRERVTILVLGIDQRCDEEGPTRTDTMMVFTMDPVGLSAAVLSLPRDLWVEIPGFGVDRINEAHFLGEVYDYPGGGPALAVETVEATLGVKIDYFATVNFDAFVQVVDQVGGIDVVVTETINDDQYPDRCYGYDPFTIEAGQQHLDGTMALKYARTRATFGGDVDRAARQQQVVMALRDKALQLNMAPQLVAGAPELWRIFQNNVRTNLTLNEVIQLALLAQEIPSSSIRTEVIDYNYVYNETTPDGRQVLVPVRENIRLLRDELFAPPAIPTPVLENIPEMIVEEEARVAVYNGTSVYGLAAATQQYLLDHDINVVEVGNADSATYRTSQIIDYGSHPNTTLYLVQLMGIPPLNVSNGTRPGGDFDVLIILGNDWQVPDP